MAIDKALYAAPQGIDELAQCSKHRAGLHMHIWMMAQPFVIAAAQTIQHWVSKKTWG